MCDEWQEQEVIEAPCWPRDEAKAALRRERRRDCRDVYIFENGTAMLSTTKPPRALFMSLREFLDGHTHAYDMPRWTRGDVSQVVIWTDENRIRIGTLSRDGSRWTERRPLEHLSGPVGRLP